MGKKLVMGWKTPVNVADTPGGIPYEIPIHNFARGVEYGNNPDSGVLTVLQLINGDHNPILRIPTGPSFRTTRRDEALRKFDRIYERNPEAHSVPIVRGDFPQDIHPFMPDNAYIGYLQVIDGVLVPEGPPEQEDLVARVELVNVPSFERMLAAAEALVPEGHGVFVKPSISENIHGSIRELASVERILPYQSRVEIYSI